MTPCFGVGYSISGVSYLIFGVVSVGETRLWSRGAEAPKAGTEQPSESDQPCHLIARYQPRMWRMVDALPGAIILMLLAKLKFDEGAFLPSKLVLRK